MCGIFGIITDENSKTFDIIDYTINSLVELEYRGYDSCGISAIHGGSFFTIKAIGEPKNLFQKTRSHGISSNVAIGHNRWATHGRVSIANTHPHIYKNYAVVHNGIVENHLEIKEMLTQNGYRTQNHYTDTAIIPRLLDFLVSKKKLSFSDAFLVATQLILKGSSVIVAANSKTSEVLATTNAGPIIVGQNDLRNITFLTSDYKCLHDATETFFLSSNLVFFCDKNKKKILIKATVSAKEEPQIIIQKTSQEIQNMIVVSESEIPFVKNPTDYKIYSQKGNYSHFMHREIVEQQDTISEIFVNRQLNRKNSILDVVRSLESYDFERIYLVGCGSSYNACRLLSDYSCETLCIDTDAKISSEFSVQRINNKQKKLAIFISQSGETMDSILAIKHAITLGAITLGIINRPGSTMEKICDHTILVDTSTEHSVAATKSFTAQLMTGFLFLTQLANHHGIITADQLDAEISKLSECSVAIAEVLGRQNEIKTVAEKVAQKSKSIFFIGRLLGFSLAMEGALKMKEVSYIPCEAIPAGELKHGHLAIVDPKTTVIAILLENDLKTKILSNIEEVLSRGGNVVVVCDPSLLSRLSHKSSKVQICTIQHLNSLSDLFSAAVILQLLSYFTALYLKHPIDMPRNLAKSITVE